MAQAFSRLWPGNKGRVAISGRYGWPAAETWPKIRSRRGRREPMKLIGQLEDQVDVRLSLEELVLLRNILNEVCNGMSFTDNDFLTILDAQRSEAEDLLNRVNTALDRLDLLPG
jgi:hypothetical protein